MPPHSKRFCVELAALALILGLGAWPSRAAAPPSPAPGPPTPQPSARGPSDARVERLIAQLGDRDYALRQQAQEELSRIGFAAHEALLAASSCPDLEIAARAKYLLRVLRASVASEEAPAQVKQLLEGYDLHQPEIRMQVVRQLALFSDLGGMPAVCGLLCLEESPLVSKCAAAAILNGLPPDAGSQARLAKILKRHLTGSRRTGAKWLLTYLELREDPKKNLEAWARLVEEEQAVWERSPKQSGPAVVVPLLYALAEAQARLGQPAQADATARRARELAPGVDNARLQARLEVATSLRRRGRFDWAEQEYRQLAASNHAMARFSGYRELSEMFHDRGAHRKAADTCRQALEALKERDSPWGDLADGPRTARARMHYFLACHYAEQGDVTRQGQSLTSAMQADPGEIDTLIACYHLRDQGAAFRKTVVAAIGREADELRRQIADEPDNPESYNQFAWLVGNTEGNLDEALRCSQKSLELSPNTGSYLDTLAHVYFAKGDLEEAVKHQTKAAELEPHSGLIARKLEVFRAALGAKRSPR